MGYIAQSAYNAQKREYPMSERIRVILLLDQSLPEAARAELGALLEDSGWASASDDETVFVCRARMDKLEIVEQRVRKSIEFAAFTAGQTGRFPFVLKVGDGEPRALVARVGEKTAVVKARSSGLDFATERLPAQLPRDLRSPSLTQLKTAF
jgi:hypothetical protein